MPYLDPRTDRINALCFNQNFECFASGDGSGLRVFNASPLKEIRREFFPSGVTFVELLYRCNYVALVGSQPTKVLIWDCGIGKTVVELEMGEIVRAVRLRRDFIVVVVEHAVVVFSFSDIPIQLMRIRTERNARGLCAVSASGLHPYAAFPSSAAPGAIELLHLPSKDRRRIYAHTHCVQAISFNSTGNLIATASSNGTIVRVFDTEKGSLIHEFRRGTNSAKIFCINFSADSKLLCVSSDHSTIHVFALESNSNGSRTFSGLFRGSPSVWKINVRHKHDICQCAFEQNSNSVIAIGLDGSYYSFGVDKKSGQYTQQSYCLFTELNSRICDFPR